MTYMAMTMETAMARTRVLESLGLVESRCQCSCCEPHYLAAEMAAACLRHQEPKQQAHHQMQMHWHGSCDH